MKNMLAILLVGESILLGMVTFALVWMGWLSIASPGHWPSQPGLVLGVGTVFVGLVGALYSAWYLAGKRRWAAAVIVLSGAVAIGGLAWGIGRCCVG